METKKENEINLRPKFKTGWQDIPEAEYQYGKKYRYCLRNSGLKAMQEGPDVFWWDKNHPEEINPFNLSTQERSKQRGRMFYSAIHSHLTGQQQDIIVLAFDDYRSKGAQKAYAEAVIKHSGCHPVILEKDWDEVVNIANSVAAHPIAAGILEHPDAIFEQAGIFEISPGVYGMIKPDIRIPPQDIEIDMKALGRATPSGFYMQARKNGYHYQDYWYRHGTAKIERVGAQLKNYAFAFLGYETDPPYRCNLFYFRDFNPGDEAFEKMREKVDNICEAFTTCLESDNWDQDMSPKPIRVPY